MENLPQNIYLDIVLWGFGFKAIVAYNIHKNRDYIHHLGPIKETNWWHI
jgi:hypothetical protein